MKSWPVGDFRSLMELTPHQIMVMRNTPRACTCCGEVGEMRGPGYHVGIQALSWMPVFRPVPCINCLATGFDIMGCMN